tara:strand:+ start:217 stop:657 length:441 start_codon:yes stop_codon:yes gene_type:complete
MYDYNFKLERVIDADSLRGSLDLGLNVWLHNVDLRLFAIDAPETRSRDKMHKRHGLTAKKYVEDMLEVGTTYRVKTYKDTRGKFGRILAKVYHRGITTRCLNEELCLKHLAVPYHGASKDDVKKAHKSALKALLAAKKIPLVELKK